MGDNKDNEDVLMWDSKEVWMFLCAGYMNTVDRDKFLVMAMEVTGDTYDTSLWKTAPKDTIMEHRYCVLTHALMCTVHTQTPTVALALLKTPSWNTGTASYTLTD
jgi:hypothetical protein